MNNKIREWFVFTAAVILIVFSAFGFLAITNGTHILDQPDALFPESSRQILYGLAIIQLIASVVLLVCQNPGFRLVIAAWSGCIVLLYQALTLHYGNPILLICLSNNLFVSPKLLNFLIFLIYGGLTLAAYGFLTAGIFKRDKTTNQINENNLLISARLKNLLAGFGSGIAIFAVMVAVWDVRNSLRLPQHLNEMAEEIYFHGGIQNAPTEGFYLNDLFYLQETGGDLKLFRLNVPSLKSTQVKNFIGMARNRDFKWIGWLPDKHEFACFFKDRETKQMAITIYEGTNGKPEDRFSAGEILEAVWLTTNSLVFVDSSQHLFLLNRQPENRFGEYGKQGIVDLRLKGRYKGLIPISNKSIAYAGKNSIWTLDLSTHKSSEVVHLPKGTVQDLHYSAFDNKFLFTIFESQNGNDHFIYQFNPNAADSSQLTKLAPVSGSSPSWVEGNNGIAFVSANADKTFLVIQPQDPTLTTNLFIDTKFQDYMVSSDGERIYAVAYDNREVSRLWEYNIQTKTLRILLPKNDHEAFREVIKPVEMAATNKLGDSMVYCAIQPAGFNPEKKYAVVFDQTPSGDFERNGQLIANAGIFYVAENASKTNKISMPIKFDDVEAIYQQLLNNPNIDNRRIYILGQNGSTEAAASLATDHPEMWRGVILVSPENWPHIAFEATNFPSVFISVGGKDREGIQDTSERFIQDAYVHFIPAKIDYQKNAQELYHLEHYEECYKAIVKFILTDY